MKGKISYNFHDVDFDFLIDSSKRLANNITHTIMNLDTEIKQYAIQWGKNIASKPFNWAKTGFNWATGNRWANPKSDKSISDWDKWRQEVQKIAVKLVQISQTTQSKKSSGFQFALLEQISSVVSLLQKLENEKKTIKSFIPTLQFPYDDLCGDWQEIYQGKLTFFFFFCNTMHMYNTNPKFFVCFLFYNLGCKLQIFKN